MGLDYRGDLLLHAGSWRWAWSHRPGGVYAISGLRLIPDAGIICDLGILRLVKNQKGNLRRIFNKEARWKEILSCTPLQGEGLAIQRKSIFRIIRFRSRIVTWPRTPVR